MAAAYDVVPYRPEFRDAIARLQTLVWSPDPRLNLAYLTWKHEQNPWRREPLIYLALSGGELVGMRSFIAAPWEAGSPATVFEALYAGDFAIASAHRDRGLASQIMRVALGDLSRGHGGYLFNLSPGRITHLASLATGWKSALTVDPIGRRNVVATTLLRARFRLRRIPGIGGAASRMAIAASAAGNPFPRLERWVARHGNPRVTIARTPRSAEMADLVSRLPYDGRIRQVRDAAFLDWRYRNPLRDYRFLYWDDGRLDGYLALQTGRAPFGRVHIVDFEARDDGVREDLLRAAIAGRDYPELGIWSTSLGPPLRRLFEERGFRPLDGALTARGLPCVLVRPLGAAPPPGDWTVAGRRLLDPGSWDLRMIYSMHG